MSEAKSMKSWNTTTAWLKIGKLFLEDAICPKEIESRLCTICLFKISFEARSNIFVQGVHGRSAMHVIYAQNSNLSIH